MTEMIIFIACLVAFGLGWKAREIQAARFVASYRKMLEAAANQQEVDSVMVDIQRDGDTFFIYNKTTGEFLAQGESHDEVSSSLKQRFPTKTFTTTQQNLKDVGYL